MTKIKLLIVDDEPVSRDILRKYISDIPGMILSAECKDAFEATRYLAEQSTDLIFLDINMPRLSGVSFARSLTSSPLIIFTTAYPEYAVVGFELNAVDYLLKPISFDRFMKAANKARDKFEANAPAVTGGVISKKEDYMFVKADKKLIKVKEQPFIKQL